MNLPDWYRKWWGMSNAYAASPSVAQPGPLPIALGGSLQNPAWSPDGSNIVFTRFFNGYNKGPADIYIYDLATKGLRSIAHDGSDNVSQPGSTWNKATDQIVFSSDRDGHDEVWASPTGGNVHARKVTARSGLMAYEPSWSPDGKSVVFESHRVDEEGNGRIAIVAGGQYEWLTADGADCRQPNWSPRGDYIVYQSHGRYWELWTYSPSTKRSQVITSGLPGDKTDATFSPDGARILYSGERLGDAGDGLLTIAVAGGRPVAVDHGPGYWGAASWSPDGKWIAAETSTGDPDGGPGTKLAIVRAP